MDNEKKLLLIVRMWALIWMACAAIGGFAAVYTGDVYWTVITAITTILFVMFSLLAKKISDERESYMILSGKLKDEDHADPK